MRRWSASLLAGWALLGGAVAHGQGYPGRFGERPLILPNVTVQPEVRFGYEAVSQGSSATRLLLGLDAGIVPKIQGGILVGLRLDPDTSFEVAVGSFQYGLADFWNARLDVGVTKTPAPDNSYRFIGGVGLPFKFRLHSNVAITSERPYSYGFVDDLFTFNVGDNSFATVGLPLGLLISFTEMLALELRSGYRQELGKSVNIGYVPLGVDLEANLLRLLDIGVTVELAGKTNAPAGDPNGGYADIIDFWFWLQFRI